ncbi:Motile sperm domain-containing protein 2 [Bulinus truncatus]|nr:Motile sperm domain-containing protein 2 [Bulinus truncatus]
MGGDENVQYIRENFTKKYAENIQNGTYDSRDLERLQKDSDFVRSYVRGNDRLDEGVDLVHSSLKFRNEIKVNDLTENSFDKELFELGAVYFHKRDIKGHRIMWFRVKLHRKDAPTERLNAEKKGVVYAMEKAFNENPLSPIVVLLDMTSCGLVNLDIDFVKYIITIFKFYYPTFLAYMLIYDMPWIFNAAWKLIKSWLSPDAAAKIRFVTKVDIQTYIKIDDLPPHMGGTDTFEFQYQPGMGDEPLYPEDKNKHSDKKVHFLEAEEDMKAISPALSKAESESDLQLDHNFNSSSALRQRAGNRNNNSNEVRRHVPLSRSQSFTSPPASFVGPLLTVSPAEELIFQVGDGGDSFDMISLTNSLPVPVAFKVKTTAPEKFRVRPSAGIIKPDKKEEVYVYLVPDFNADIAKDKFLVMAMETAATNVADPNSLFKDAPRDKIMQHKMRCTTTSSKDRRVASPDEKLASKVEQLERQTKSLQTQLRFLMCIQFVTAFALILVMLAYSCYGEELFSRFLALPFDFCNDPYGRKC